MKKTWVSTFGACLLCVFCAFYAYFFLGLIGLSALVPWDGTTPEFRPPAESFERRMNAYFEAGSGNDLVFLAVPAISLGIFLLRMVVKREPLKYLFLNTAIAYALYPALFIYAFIPLVILRTSQERGYNFVELGVQFGLIICVYFLQYSLDVSPLSSIFKRKQISVAVHG